MLKLRGSTLAHSLPVPSMHLPRANPIRKPRVQPVNHVMHTLLFRACWALRIDVVRPGERTVATADETQATTDHTLAGAQTLKHVCEVRMAETAHQTRAEPRPNFRTSGMRNESLWSNSLWLNRKLLFQLHHQLL